jgi:hypothetical protein
MEEDTLTSLHIAQDYLMVMIHIGEGFSLNNLEGVHALSLSFLGEVYCLTNHDLVSKINKTCFHSFP